LRYGFCLGIYVDGPGIGHGNGPGNGPVNGSTRVLNTDLRLTSSSGSEGTFDADAMIGIVFHKYGSILIYRKTNEPNNIIIISIFL
jgi:hypothetical protein